MRAAGPGPYRVAPPRRFEGRPPQGRGAAVVVAMFTWITVAATRSPVVLIGALVLTVPVVARRFD